MSESMKLELEILKKKRKFEAHDFDLVMATFYFAGQFGQSIPVDFGREAFEIILKKLKK